MAARLLAQSIRQTWLKEGYDRDTINLPGTILSRCPLAELVDKY